MSIYQIVKKVLICIVGAALLLGGLYFLAAEAFLAHRTFLRIVILGLMLTLMGGYLLWAELVAPRLDPAKK